SSTAHAFWHRRALVALEQAEDVPLAVLAASEPADARDRLLVLGLAAELLDLGDVRVDVVAAEVERRPRHAFHAVDAAALIAFLPHQVLHAAHAGVLDLPAADHFPELPPALEILRRELDVHDSFTHGHLLCR